MVDPDFEARLDDLPEPMRAELRTMKNRALAVKVLDLYDEARPKGKRGIEEIFAAGGMAMIREANARFLARINLN